jgi:hypothetical protein
VQEQVIAASEPAPAHCSCTLFTLLLHPAPAAVMDYQ